MDGGFLNLLLSVGTIASSVGAAYAVTRYRINRLEKDRDNDVKDIRELSKKGSEDRGRIWRRLDETIQAGGILESRVSGLENVLDPAQIHERNRREGAFEARTEERLSRNEDDVRRLEDHMIRHIQSDCKSKEKG